MKYALIKDGVIVDLTRSTPSEIFMAEVAEQYQEVPDEARRGDSWDGKTLTAKVVETPKVVEEVVTYRQQLTYIEFQFLFTPAERAALKAETGSILDVRIILEDARNLVFDLTAYYIKDYLNALEDAKVLTAARRRAILRGEPPKVSVV